MFFQLKCCFSDYCNTKVNDGSITTSKRWYIKLLQHYNGLQKWMIKQLIQKIYLATTFWLLLPLQWWFFWLIYIRYKSELRNSWYCITSRIIQSLLQSKSKIFQLDISIFLTFMDPSIIQESVTYIEDFWRFFKTFLLLHTRKR